MKIKTEKPTSIFDARFQALDAGSKAINEQQQEIDCQRTQLINHMLVWLEMQNEPDFLSVARVAKLSGWGRQIVEHLIDRGLLETVGGKQNLKITKASYLALRLRGAEDLIKSLKKGRL